MRRQVELSFVGQRLLFCCTSESAAKWFEHIAAWFHPLVTEGSGDPKYVCYVSPGDGDWAWFELHKAATEEPIVRTRLFSEVMAWIAERCMLLHAGCIADRNGSAILLMGPSGSGKTTAAVLMGRMGYDLISDDMTAVHLDDLKVRAFPTFVSIKTSSPFYEPLGGRPTNPVGTDSYLDPALLGCRIAQNGMATPIGRIIRMHFDPSMPPHSCRMTRSSAVRLLLSQTISVGTPCNGGLDIGKCLEICAKLAETAECSEVWADSLQTARSLLDSRNRDTSMVR